MAPHIVSSEDQQIKAPYFKLYALNTDNGCKVTILLEFLNVEYHLKIMDIEKREHKQPWYLKLTPNGKIPSITDVDSQGNEIHINETVAVIIFICDKYDKERRFSYGPESFKLYYEQMEWSLFIATALTPVRYNLLVYKVFSKEKLESVIQMYRGEIVRCLSVLEEQLRRNGTGFLIGDKLSIVDIAAYPDVHYEFPGIFNFDESSLDDFPLLKEWDERLSNIPEFFNGRDVAKLA